MGNGPIRLTSNLKKGAQLHTKRLNYTHNQAANYMLTPVLASPAQEKRPQTQDSGNTRNSPPLPTLPKTSILRTALLSWK
jgi:hypothetical protein